MKNNKQVPRVCANCSYYEVVSGYEGACRRFPPLLRENHRDFPSFPRVDAISWCGEFKARTMQSGPKNDPGDNLKERYF